MHVCYVTTDYHGPSTGGGIASYVATLSAGLVARGHTITILTRGQRSEVYEEQGVRVVRIPLGNVHWYLHKLHAPSPAILPVRQLEWSAVFRRRLELLLGDGPIDLVEGHESGILFLTRASKQSLPPLVIRLHGDPYVFAKFSGRRISLGNRLNRQLQLYVMRRAGALTAPSRFQAQQISDQLKWSGECPLGVVRVIPNPLSYHLRAEAERTPVAHVRGGPVLYTGRVERNKGTLILLQSIPYVQAAIPDVEYIVAGGRHVSIDDAALEHALAVPNVRRHVRLLGHRPWRDLVQLYRQAGVFVMPSLFEAFGLSVVEAMAFGLPVVATRTGGLVEVVEDGVTAIVVPPGDPVALADAIRQILSDPTLARRLGDAGRERALAQYSPDAIVDRTLELYRQVVASRE